MLFLPDITVPLCNLYETCVMGGQVLASMPVSIMDDITNAWHSDRIVKLSQPNLLKGAC